MKNNGHDKHHCNGRPRPLVIDLANPTAIRTCARCARTDADEIEWGSDSVNLCQLCLKPDEVSAMHTLRKVENAIKPLTEMHTEFCVMFVQRLQAERRDRENQQGGQS